MKRFDFAVPIGLLIGLTAILGSALLEGINPGFMWQPRAALVVLGGTVGALYIRHGAAGLRSTTRASLRLCVKESTAELEGTIARLAWLARAARRDGLRVLEKHAAGEPDPLVVRALLLTAEYAEPAAVRRVLDRMLDDEDEAGACDAATLEAAGGYAPTFGILGAVLGLISVLGSLADSSALGSGIATAFVATLYGLGFANLLFFPLASKLRERHAARIKQREILVDALVILAAHESPSQILNCLNTVPAPLGENRVQLKSRSAVAQ